MCYDAFEKYLNHSDPEKAKLAVFWKTAICLQSVDGLKPSNYLVELAIKNIEGELTFEQVEKLIDTYNKQNIKSFFIILLIKITCKKTIFSDGLFSKYRKYSFF